MRDAIAINLLLAWDPKLNNVIDFISKKMK
jgi:hypothetical protein